MKLVPTTFAAATMAAALAMTASAFANGPDRSIQTQTTQRTAQCSSVSQGHPMWESCASDPHFKNTGDRRDEQVQHGRSLDAVSHGL
jgi:hypothetical protein